jgi:hypothetical protein
MVTPGTLNQLNQAGLNQIGQQSGPLFFVARLVNRLASLNPVEPAVNLHNPYSMQYGLTVEQPLGNQAVLSVGLVGTQGRHLLRVSTPDQPIPGQSLVDLMKVASVTGKLLMPTDPGCQSQVVDAATTPFPVFAVCTQSADWTLRPPTVPGVRRTLYESTAISNYTSLQTQLRMRPYRGFQGGAAFTWSHALDDASDFFDTANGPALPQDSFHRTEYASADFDARKRVALYGTWQTSAQAGPLARNWLISWMYTFQTGQAFTVNSAIDVNQDGNLTDRPDTVQGLSPGQDRRTIFVLAAPSYKLLSTAEPGYAGQCLNDPVSQVNHCDGGLGRNTFRAPGVGSLDAAVGRQFHLAGSDARQLQIRLECFNVLNRAQFGIPVRILEAPSVGSSATTVGANRVVQLALRLSF